MKEDDLEVLITLDDPGEDTLEEDHFHDQDSIASARPTAEGGKDA